MDSEQKMTVWIVWVVAVSIVALASLWAMYSDRALRYYTQNGYTQRMLPGQRAVCWVKDPSPTMRGAKIWIPADTNEPSVHVAAAAQ